LGEAKDFSKVVDAESSLKSGNSTASGSIEVSVDGAEVNTLCDHGNSLTNDLNNVVQAKGIGGLSANTLNKADELGSQSDGIRESRLNLENKLFSFIYNEM
jgi:hypothetical protein